jgi:hypothetical protein
MKTAYELAMERLNKTSPSRKLTQAQKQALGDLESRCTAKIAELEIGLKADMARAQEAGDAEAMEQAQNRLSAERRKLQADLEEKKEAIRQGKA